VGRPNNPIDYLIAAMAELDGAKAAAHELRDVLESIQQEVARSALTWTSDEPTRPGWYWVRLVAGHGGQIWRPRIAQVVIDSKAGVLTDIDRTGPWHWAGPIPEPVEGEEGARGVADDA
jgi:hypothetical protein